MIPAPPPVPACSLTPPVLPGARRDLPDRVSAVLLGFAVLSAGAFGIVAAFAVHGWLFPGEPLTPRAGAGASRGPFGTAAAELSTLAASASRAKSPDVLHVLDAIEVPVAARRTTAAPSARQSEPSPPNGGMAPRPRRGEAQGGSRQPIASAPVVPAPAPVESATAPVAAIEDSMRPLHALLPELAPGDVRRVVENQRVRMRQCYDRALRRVGRPEAVTVSLRVRVLRTGRVGGVRVQGRDLADLHGCLTELAQRWRFPPSRRGADVPIPLVFAPR